jgi:hypothetical protein
LYPRTQKQQYTKGISLQERRERILRGIKLRDPQYQSSKNNLEQHSNPSPSSSYSHPSTFIHHDEDLSNISPYEHHYISSDRRSKIDLFQWLGENNDDLALKVLLSLIFPQLTLIIIHRILFPSYAVIS